MPVRVESRNHDTPRLVNTKEIARVLGVSTKTIWDWVATDRIPYHRIGRVLRFDPGQVKQATAGGNTHGNS